jgi:hypothetical protein
MYETKHEDIKSSAEVNDRSTKHPGISPKSSKNQNITCLRINTCYSAVYPIQRGNHTSD